MCSIGYESRVSENIVIVSAVWEIIHCICLLIYTALDLPPRSDLAWIAAGERRPAPWPAGFEIQLTIDRHFRKQESSPLSLPVESRCSLCHCYVAAKSLAYSSIPTTPPSHLLPLLETAQLASPQALEMMHVVSFGPISDSVSSLLRSKFAPSTRGYS